MVRDVHAKHVYVFVVCSAFVIQPGAIISIFAMLFGCIPKTDAVKYDYCWSIAASRGHEQRMAIVFDLLEYFYLN